MINISEYINESIFDIDDETILNKQTKDGGYHLNFAKDDICLCVVLDGWPKVDHIYINVIKLTHVHNTTLEWRKYNFDGSELLRYYIGLHKKSHKTEKYPYQSDDNNMRHRQRMIILPNYIAKEAAEEIVSTGKLSDKYYSTIPLCKPNKPHKIYVKEEEGAKTHIRALSIEELKQRCKPLLNS